jgi:hypothetical protein
MYYLKITASFIFLSRYLLLFLLIQSCKPAVETKLQATRNLGTEGCTPQDLERRSAVSRETSSNDFSVMQVAFQSGGPSDEKYFGLSSGEVQNKVADSDPCADAIEASNSAKNPIRDGLVTVGWKCSGRGRMKAGGLKQDEYCEWERVTRNPESPLTCTFTSSFDHSRRFHLTARKETSAWSDTQFNSYAYLAGGTETTPRVTRRGIIGHCVKKPCGAGDAEKPNYFGNCVSSRASDPEICEAVNNAVVKNGCRVSVPVSTINTARPSVLREVALQGDREIKLFLRASAGVKKDCKHIVDPNFGDATPFDPNIEGTLMRCEFGASDKRFSSCDDVSNFIEVVSSMTLSGCRK